MMPAVEILRAPAAAGKTNMLCDLLRQHAGPAIVLVPDAEQQAALRGRLGHRRSMRIMPFAQLAALILRLAGQRPIQVTPLGQRTLIGNLLLKLREHGHLSTFAAVAEKPGFIAATTALFADLSSAAIGPERYAAVAVTPHDHELAALYRAYMTFQEQHGLADLPRRLQQAQFALAAQPNLLAPTTLLAVDGFTQYTPTQLGLLAALVQCVPCTIITLTGEAHARPALRRFQHTLAELQATLGDLQITEVVSPALTLAPALRHLQQHLFELDRPLHSPPVGSAVLVIEAPDHEREVRAALRQAARLIAKGANPQSIAILLRNPETYTTLIDQVAREYQLPIELRAGLRLVQAPPIVAVLALLRLVVSDFAPQAVQDVVRSPYLSRSATQDETEMASPPDPAAQLQALLIAPGDTSNLGHVTWVRDRLSVLIDPVVQNDRDRAALRVFDHVLDGLAQIDRLIDRPARPLPAFLADLEAACSSARVQPPGSGIVVLPTLAARGLIFEHVVLLGLSEGEIPPALPEPPIYGRAGQRRLRERGLDLPTPDPADERALFYEALARARTSLILARTRLDPSGNGLARSPYLREVFELLPATPVLHIAAGGLPGWDEAASPHEQALAATARPDWAMLSLPSYPAWAHAQRAAAIEQAREGFLPYGPFEGVVAGTAAAALAHHFGPHYEWSVTELNDYLICPFRFGAAHVLNLQPALDDQTLGLNAVTRGLIEHAILAAAAQHWRAHAIIPAPTSEAQIEAILEQLDLVAEGVLESAPTRFQFVPSSIWAWERDTIKCRIHAAVAAWMAADPGWGGAVPTELERGFGGRSGRPALQVVTPEGPVLVQGRIDRLDQLANGALALFDYKAGGAHTSSQTLTGRDLQLALYAMAATQQIRPGAQVERAAFLQIGRGEIQGALDQTDIQQAVPIASKQVAMIVAAVRSGDLRVRPRECPDFCAYEAICRRNLAKRDASEE